MYQWDLGISSCPSNWVLTIPHTIPTSAILHVPIIFHFFENFFLNSCEVYGFFNLIIMNCHYAEFKIKTWPILVCAHISSDMKVSMFGWQTWRIRKTVRQFKLYPHENKNFQVIMTPWIFMAITLFIAQSAKSLIIKFSVSSTQYTAVNMNTYWMYVHSIKSSWHSVTHQYIQ